MATNKNKERKHFIKKQNKRKHKYYPKKLNTLCKEDCKNCPYKCSN